MDKDKHVIVENPSGGVVYVDWIAKGATIKVSLYPDGMIDVDVHVEPNGVRISSLCAKLPEPADAPTDDAIAAHEEGDDTSPLNRDDVGAWPWTVAAAHPDEWSLITTEHADTLLNVMPPIYVPGGFCVSEAIRGSDAGEVYLCVLTYNDETWVRELTITEAKQAYAGLIDAVRAE